MVLIGCFNRGKKIQFPKCDIYFIAYEKSIGALYNSILKNYKHPNRIVPNINNS